MEENFKPGLFNLNMNIMHVLDVPMIQDELEALSIRQEVEHSCVWNVLQNMIAILKSRLPRQRIYAKKDLEYILESDKDNLNALADLENIYRSLHRVADAERCRKNIQRIILSKHQRDLKAKAICLMEQGYAILHDMSANLETIAGSRLTDAHRMLQVEHSRSENKRKMLLRKCVFHNKQAISQLEQSADCNRTNEYFIRKVNSLAKFEEAHAICENLPNWQIWSYYIGEAWNRHVDSLRRLTQQDKINRAHDISEATCKALEIFFDILECKEKLGKKNIYVSRSLSHVGHILINRSKLLNLEDSRFTFLQSEMFKEFFAEPVKALERGFQMQRNCPDTFVMNRYGRALLNLASKKETNDKLALLEQANNILTKSINTYRMNWFAYSTRMQVLDALGDLMLSKNRRNAWDLYQNAKRDGHQCFTSKGSSIDMQILAKICQKLAKFPNINRYGSFYVNDQKYLYLSLDYLQHGFSFTGSYDYELSKRMASCLYDLDEFISASEWMKRTLSLSGKPNLFIFKLVCLYFLKRFGMETKEGKKSSYLVKEIIYLILDCKKKIQVINITNELYEYLLRNDFQDISTLIQDVIRVPNLLKQNELSVIHEILKCASTMTNLTDDKMTKIKEFETQMLNVEPLEETELMLEETFRGSSAPIPISSTSSFISEDFEYDFFISHSQKDSDWVNNVLLSELENRLNDDEFAFKGCIADRDFMPGTTIIQNITNAITRSYKIILVLSKHFISSRWCTHEMERALIRHISKKDCIIPVLLDPLECDEIPDCLQNITYLDLTDETQMVQSISRLKMALLPGD